MTVDTCYHDGKHKNEFVVYRVYGVERMIITITNENNLIKDRTSKFVKHALIIIIRGLYRNWTFTMCYFLASNGVNGNNLNVLIKESVKYILEVGLLPSVILCDQRTQN